MVNWGLMTWGGDANDRVVESVGEVDDVIRNPFMLSCEGEFGRSESESSVHAIVWSFLGSEFWGSLMILSCPADNLVGKFRNGG